MICLYRGTNNTVEKVDDVQGGNTEEHLTINRC